VYNKYKGQGFEVLAFPCNQFGEQCGDLCGSGAKAWSAKYKADFPLFAEIEVNGDKAHPFYQYLKSAKGGLLPDVKWNFGKFLIGKDGKCVDRFAPTDSPTSLEGKIKELL